MIVKTAWREIKTIVSICNGPCKTGTCPSKMKYPTSGRDAEFMTKHIVFNNNTWTRYIDKQFWDHYTLVSMPLEPIKQSKYRNRFELILGDQQ